MILTIRPEDYNKFIYNITKNKVLYMHKIQNLTIFETACPLFIINQFQILLICYLSKRIE